MLQPSGAEKGRRFALSNGLGIDYSIELGLVITDLTL